jgi:hypothetical protein
MSVAAFLLAAAGFALSLYQFLQNRGEWICCDDDDTDCDCGCGCSDDCVDSEVFDTDLEDDSEDK